jgi:hypothetical protein
VDAFTPLIALVAAAAAAGCVHTLLGPDHYVPMIALARLRGWSRTRALVWTAVFGIAHCATTVAAVAVAGDAAGEGSALRSDLAAALLAGVGIALLLAALRRRRSAGRFAGGWTGLLFAAFAVGPCEWLVPALAGAFAEQGASGFLVVAASFTAATGATMVAAVAIALRALPAPRAREARWLAIAPGLAIAASGLAIAVGL